LITPEKPEPPSCWKHALAWAHFQFLLWLIPTIEKFPRSQKFLLGDRGRIAAVDRNYVIGFRLARTLEE